MNTRFYAVFHDVSTINVANVYEDCYLCIAKAGYIPFVARVGDVVYLQNETIQNKMPIYSRHVYLGSDVTTDREHGPVVIKQGEVNCIGQASVVINGYTIVKKGGALSVK